MEQTPIEKAIAELEEKISFPLSNRSGDHEKGERAFIETYLQYLKTLLPYEKTYHRNIAEKAVSNTIQIMQNIPDSQKAQLEVETYLNQNHPL